MKRVFADTFYFLAMVNSNDRFHDAAVSWSTSSSCRYVTTSWILVELADALCAPRARDLTVQFIDALHHNRHFHVVGPDRQWFDRGWSLYSTRPDKEWSLTDCISFCVRKELGLTEALTGDHHFEQAGFRALFARR